MHHHHSLAWVQLYLLHLYMLVALALWWAIWRQGQQQEEALALLGGHLRIKHNNHNNHSSNSHSHRWEYPSFPIITPVVQE
jgi:hypothetical protein